MNNATEEITITIPPRPTRSHFGDVRLKPYTFWLPSPDDPVFIERMRKSSEAIAHAMKHSKDEQRGMRKCEAAAAELLKDEPPYDWGDEERVNRQCLALRDDPEEKEWDRWCEAAFAETMKDEPAYEWGN